MARSARMHPFVLMLSGVSSRCQVDRSSLVAGLSLSQLATTHAGFRVLRGFTHTVSRHPASPTRRQRQSPDAHLLLHPWQEDRVLWKKTSAFVGRRSRRARGTFGCYTSKRCRGTSAGHGANGTAARGNRSKLMYGDDRAKVVG